MCIVIVDSSRLSRQFLSGDQSCGGCYKWIICLEDFTDVFNLSKSSFLDLILPCNSFPGLKVILFVFGYTVVKDAQPRPAYNNAVTTRYLLYNPMVCEVLLYIPLHSFSIK